MEALQQKFEAACTLTGSVAEHERQLGESELQAFRRRDDVIAFTQFILCMCTPVRHGWSSA